MAMHFPGQLPEYFAPLFQRTIIFFRLSQKLVVGGFFLEKFPEIIIGLFYPGNRRKI
jgi:hypothetical protein